MLPKEREEEARTHLGHSHRALASGAVRARGSGGQRHGGCRTESGEHLETSPSGLQGAPAGRGWPWRRSRAPLSAPRRSAKVGSGSRPGISPVSYPQPRPSGPPPPPRTRAEVPSRLPSQARSPAARTSRSSATPRGSPRTGLGTARLRPWLGRLRTCPLGSGSGRGPPLLSWDPRPRRPPGLAETPGPAPATPGRLQVPPRPALKRKRAWGWRGSRFSCPGSAETVTLNRRESSGLGAVLPPLRPTPSWGEGGGGGLGTETTALRATKAQPERDLGFRSPPSYSHFTARETEAQSGKVAGLSALPQTTFTQLAFLLP